MTAKERLGMGIMFSGWACIVVAIAALPFVLFRHQNLAPHGFGICLTGLLLSRVGGSIAGAK